MKRRDLTGQKFGILTVTNRWESRPRRGGSRRNVFWFCQCECGTTKWIAAIDLCMGDSKSCGCQMRARASKPRTHGFASNRHKETRHPLYAIWCSMKNRCYNNRDVNWPNWGGRNIEVCDAWRNDFLQFVRDVGDRPSKQYSLDRYPNRDGNYEPGNVRWASHREQALNRRRVKAVENFAFVSLLSFGI